VNLTAITGHREVQVKHFLDSFTVLLAYPAGLPSTARLVDVGAGAGFPSLPLKLLYPDLRVSLVESTGKKTQFLEHLIGVLGLSGVEVWKGRAEELAHSPELREGFDLVLSRGVAKLPTLLEYTLPFCRLGGRVALLKRGVEEEIAGAARALDALGGRLDQTYPVRVTGLTDNRVVVAVDKVRSTPPEYPRRPGMPAKRPL
jgi:16S rRNA (guanine527-N7)-methyltransferase